MELKEAIEILKKKKEEKEKLLNEVEKTNGMPITHIYEKTQLSNELLVEIMTLDTVLQVLTIPDNADICFVGGGRTKGKTLTRTFEFGLIVGTKRERVYWEDKIKGQIKQLKKEMPHIACNKGCDKCFDENWKPLYRGRSFTFCYAYHQLKALQELLKEGK